MCFGFRELGHTAVIMSKIKTFKRLRATRRGGFVARGGFVILTEGSHMGEHLFHAKQVHSRRKCIPTRNKWDSSQEKRVQKQLINLKGMYGHRYKIM